MLTMMYAALIGSPVSHSVAPTLHEHMARLAGIEFKYLKIHVEKSDLINSLEALRQLGFSGCNVTLPYKEDVVAYLDEIDDVAAESGAVNTLVFRDGKVRGLNTDWRGVEQGLKFASLPAESSNGSVAILGSGGAARAAIFAVRRLGYQSISVFHISPIDDRAKRLQDEAVRSGFSMHEYDDVTEVIRKANLVCNMTSTGMIGQASSSFALERLDSVDLNGKYFFDAVFNPVRTPFLSYGMARGAVTVDGIWMILVHEVGAGSSSPAAQ